MQEKVEQKIELSIGDTNVNLSDLLCRLRTIAELANRGCESKEPCKCDENDFCQTCGARLMINRIEQVVCEAEKELALA